MSLLDSLAARREEIAQQHVITVHVPLWDAPTIRLRLKALDHERITAIGAKADAAPDKARAKEQLRAAAALVAAACLGVAVGDHPEVPAHDPDLKAGLEVDESEPTSAVIKALFVTDGDLLAMSNTVMKHSGYGNAAIDEALAGE